MSAEEGTASLSDDDETQTAANGEVGGSPPPAAPQPQMVLVERLSGRGGRPREIVVGTTAVLIGRSMPALEKRQTQLAAKGTECEVCHLTQPPSVSSCHAWIFFEEREQRFYVNDLKSANGTFCTSPAQYKLKTRTFVGDRKHASPAPVEIGENYILEFADVRFQVKEITGIVRPANPLDLSDEDSWEGGDTKTADPSTDVVLMVVAGPGRGEYRVVRATQPVMIGRLPDSAREASQTDLVVVDPKKSLSRKHARVYYAEDSHCYKIETLGKHPAFISTQMVGISLDDSFDVSKISSWRLCQEGFPEPLEYGNLIRCGSVVIQVRNHAGPPAKMMPPSCQDRQETSLTLSWQEGWCATDILGYVLQMSKDNCASWIAVFGSANKGHTVSDLEPGKTYHFRVRACSAGGPSEWSNPIAYTTAHPAPVDSEFVVTGEVIKGKKLGEGQFGRVYVGVVGETAVAVKEADIFPPDEDADAAQDEFLASFEAEIALLKTLYHRHIVRFLGSQTIDAGTHRVVRIFLEYFPVGSLKNWLRKVGGKLNEDITRRYTKQILTGLAYIHAHNIMHRDIKSDNILLKVTGDGKQEVALADFGCSELVNKLKGETDLAGTIHYMAPEVFKEEADFKSDIWSVGCTVIEMLTGVPPWHDLDELGFTGQVLSLGRNFSPGTAVQTTPPLPAGVSEFCTDFLQSCFRLDPEERPTAQELLAHPWLTMVSASASGIRRGSDVVLSPTGAAADRAMAASSASAPATTSTASPAAAATTPEPATAATPEAVNYQVPPGGGVTATATGASEFPDTPPTTDRIPAPRLVGEAATTGSFSPMATPTLKVNESAALSAALAAGREVAAAPEPTEANADADAGASAGVEAGDGGGPSSAAGETDGLDETQPIVS